MHGRRFCSAISWARRCFFTVVGKYVPPLTVASLATRTHSRPSITPIPVTIPAPGAWPSYISQAASAESSRKAVSGSSRRSIRSRAVSFPRERCFSSERSPPPRATCAVRSLSSATSSSIRVRRSLNSSGASTCTPSTLKLWPDSGLGLEALQVRLVALLDRAPRLPAAEEREDGALLRILERERRAAVHRQARERDAAPSR